MFKACYPNNFKIRSKADVEKAVSYMTSGMEHWFIINEVFAICIDKKKDGSYVVLYKSGDLYDIFNPTVQILDPVGTIWKHRKFINESYFL